MDRCKHGQTMFCIDCFTEATEPPVSDLRPGDEGWIPDDREVKFVVRMADALQHQRDDLAEKVEELWTSEEWRFFDDEERLASVLWAIQHDEPAADPERRNR